MACEAAAEGEAAVAAAITVESTQVSALRRPSRGNHHSNSSLCGDDSSKREPRSARRTQSKSDTLSVPRLPVGCQKSADLTLPYLQVGCVRGEGVTTSSMRLWSGFTGTTPIGSWSRSDTCHPPSMR